MPFMVSPQTPKRGFLTTTVSPQAPCGFTRGPDGFTTGPDFFSSGASRDSATSDHTERVLAPSHGGSLVRWLLR
jgi:hypothetical protein